MTLPVRGAPGSGLWGDTIDANLAILDVMDHTPGHGPLVPVAGLNINADLPFSSLWAPTQLHRVQFSAVAVAGLTAGQRKSLVVSDGTGGGVANELYWHNNAGNKVQITSGNTLNFAAFVGGIGGDYTSVGATLNYTDGQKAYEFKEGTIDSNGWARMRSGDLRLFPFNTTGATYVGMAAPGAIAGSYTMTWPLALPGSTALQQIDNTGQAIFSNTIVNDLAMTAGKHITVSTTGLYKHGTRTLQLAAASLTGLLGTAISFPGGNIIASMTGATAAVGSPIPLEDGKRILAIRIYIADNVTGPTKVNAAFSSTALTTGAETDIVVGSASAGSGAQQTLTLGSLTTVIAAGNAYTVWLKTTTGSAAVTINGIEIDYDQP